MVRKPTEDEKKRIGVLWARGRPLDIINRGWTDSVYIAKELKSRGKRALSERSVRAVIANLVRDPRRRKIVEKREVGRLLLEAKRPKDVLAGETAIARWIARETPWIARTMKNRERIVAGHMADLNSTKNRMLILDTTSESVEKKSESKFLKELLRIYDWNSAIKSRPETVKSKDDFIDELERAKEWYIHITAHGSAHDEKGKKIATMVSTGRLGITAEDIYDSHLAGKDENRLWADRKLDDRPLLIVNAACETGQKDLATAFLKAGCRFFIAPRETIPWICIAVFSTLFYYHLFAERSSPPEAFQATKKLIRSFPLLKTGKWVLYGKGMKRLT